MALKYSEERLEWVDTMKGLGIVFVVAGHTLWPTIQFSVYIFHMPLFFILSGFLFRENECRRFFTSKFKSLIIPYISYLLLLSAFEIKNIYFNPYHTSNDISTVIFNMFYGGAFLKGSLGVFWFVSVLFISQQALNIILKIGKNAVTAVIVVIMYIASYLLPASSTSPLDVLVCLQAIPFLYIGMMIRKNVINIPIFITASLSLVYFVVSYLYPDQFFIDMKSSLFGLPVIGAIGCSCIFITLISLSKSINKLSLVASIGKASMTIMFVHQFINIYMARALFDNQIYIFIFCILQSYMFHLLISKNNYTKRLLTGVA